MRRPNAVTSIITGILVLVIIFFMMLHFSDGARCERICAEHAAASSRVFSVPNVILGGNDVYCGCEDAQGEHVYSVVLHINS